MASSGAVIRSRTRTQQAYQNEDEGGSPTRELAGDTSIRKRNPPLTRSSPPRKGKLVLLYFCFIMMLGFVLGISSSTLARLFQRTSASRYVHDTWNSVFFGERGTPMIEQHSSWPGEIPSHLVDYHILEPSDLSTMVSQTKGFYARDYSLWLGWNNLRLIIDAAFLQAKVLNRTLILPSFVYARGCEEGLDACSDCAVLVNKCQTLPYELFRHLGYRVPLQLMLNITQMRAVHPVILVSDYLRIHGLSAAAEHKEGEWDRTAYHVEGSSVPAPDLFVIPKDQYDPKGIRRVDMLTDGMKSRGGRVFGPTTSLDGATGSWEQHEEDDVSRKLHRTFRMFGKLSWEEAVKTLRAAALDDMYNLSTEDGITAALQASGWEVTHTFEGIRRSDLAKTVVAPIREVVPRSILRGFVDDFGEVQARVLLLEGETHNGRKAGTMHFTTVSALEYFQRDVLYTISPTRSLQALAEQLAARMSEKVEGRLWMGAHMRRGDFVKLGWASFKSPEGHMRIVKSRLIDGRNFLKNLRGQVQPCTVPDARIDTSLIHNSPPAQDDLFYVATDERGPSEREHFSISGAVLLPDILKLTDLNDIGWPLLLTDVRVVVEQELLARAAYFTGTHMSSVAGGVLSMRAAHGADCRANSLY